MRAEAGDCHCSAGEETMKCRGHGGVSLEMDVGTTALALGGEELAVMDTGIRHGEPYGDVTMLSGVCANIDG